MSDTHNDNDDFAALLARGIAKQSQRLQELERELNASKQAPTDNDTWNSLLESRARLERELRESRAREAQLRAALESFNGDVIGRPGDVDCDVAGGPIHPEDQSALFVNIMRGKQYAQDYWESVQQVLTLPAPPVLPVEDVKPLLEILRECALHDTGEQDCIASDAVKALSTFTAKHSNLLG